MPKKPKRASGRTGASHGPQRTSDSCDFYDSRSLSPTPEPIISNQVPMIALLSDYSPQQLGLARALLLSMLDSLDRMPKRALTTGTWEVLALYDLILEDEQQRRNDLHAMEWSL
jgi:hypothetical protein